MLGIGEGGAKVNFCPSQTKPAGSASDGGGAGRGPYAANKDLGVPR